MLLNKPIIHIPLQNSEIPIENITMLNFGGQLSLFHLCMFLEKENRKMI
jgi:hypothetical protein